MDDKQAEEQYGKPDTSLVTLNDNKCEHYFVRKSASDVGCKKCHNGWIDGGRFILKDGKVEISELASN